MSLLPTVDRQHVSQKMSELLNESLITDIEPIKSDSITYIVKSSAKTILCEYFNKENAISVINKNKKLFIEKQINGKKSSTIMLNEENEPIEFDQQPKKEYNVVYDDIGWNDEKMTLLNEFLTFIEEFIDIQQIPKIELLIKREGEMTAGAYDPNRKLVKVYVKNRAFADILRSLAHELVHHKQNEDERLSGEIQNIGGEIEDEANAVAGQIIKAFAVYNDKDIIYNIDD